MSAAQFIFMGIIGTVFGWWGWLMFSTVMAQRRRAMQRTGQIFPGPRDALLEWGHWLRAPELRAERMRLLRVTVLLFAVIALMMVFLPFPTTPGPT